MAKRLISLCLCIVFAVLTVPIVPAFATEITVDIGATDFFDWVFSAGYHLMGGISSLFDDEICPSAPGLTDKHSFVERRTTVGGKTGLFYICEYCGKSAGEVGKEAYDNQVAELPETTITQESMYTLYFRDYVYGGDALLGSDTCTMFVASALYNSAKCQCNYFSNATGSMGSYVDICARSAVLHVPVSGAYRIYGHYPKIISGVSFASSSNRNNFRIFKGTPDSYVVVSYNLTEGYVIDLEAGDYFVYLNTRLGPWASSSGGAFSGSPRLVSVAQSAPVTNVYDTTTRPTSITGGNYGIVGDNGEITTVTNNNQIINETNNTYYNPATGQTSTISDWSYNYEDRSYTLTLESGDTTTVTYGDENISIIENNVVEGDTIVNNYTIYYMIDGSGSDNPSPAPSICPHSWQESSRTEPACTSPGKVVYVCSQCGQTRSETLKALGHDWQVERTVKTLYDENGNVTQQGYTIYQCSVCGEQYKDADSTGPPDNTVNDGGLIEWLNGLIKHLSDNLSGAVDLILSFFQEIPKLFGGFLDFLSAMFPYLPDDIIFLLTFGIAALVFVGVIKAIRR